MPIAQKQTLVVDRVIHENSAVTSLILSGNLSDGMRARRAGQFMTVRLPQGDAWSRPHPYTISNAPDDPWIQLTAKALGSFSTRIQSTTVGTPILVAGPYGRFCRETEEQASHVMIAGGIGITPFLSVLRHLGRQAIRRQTTLFWASNLPEDFFCVDELTQLCDRIGLKMILVSLHPWSGQGQPSDTEGLLRQEGYLTRQLLQEHSDPAGSRVYLCGSDNMQAFVLGELAACGMPADAVSTESFGTFNFDQKDQGAL